MLQLKHISNSLYILQLFICKYDITMDQYGGRELPLSFKHSLFKVEVYLKLLRKIDFGILVEMASPASK